MSFNSWQFLVFLPIVIIGYYLLPHKIRWIWLLIASYYFYMSWNPWLVFLIAGTTLVSYLAAILIEKTPKKGLKEVLSDPDARHLPRVSCLLQVFQFPQSERH
jgi:alginate O-acetyltransferase complex protein AlgI